MYKELNAQDFKKYFDLPEDYTVDGFLSYGNYDIQDMKAHLARSLERFKLKTDLKQQHRFLQNIFEAKIGNKTYWFAVEYGGATLSEYTHLACTFGSKKNIHIGSCGGLNPEINSLDFIIPNWSYGNESSARMYDKDNFDYKFEADLNLSNRLKESIEKLGNKSWVGPIVNCEAIFAETLQDIENWSKKGYFGVEMETGTIFSVSSHFKVPSAALLYVSDNLIKKQILNDGSYKSQKELRDKKTEELFDAAISVLFQEVA